MMMMIIIIIIIIIITDICKIIVIEDKLQTAKATNMH